jgi:hypothetical protein
VTPEERADRIIAGFEVTTMGCLGGRYDDQNHVRGVTVGVLRRKIEHAIRAAVAEERAACTDIAIDHGRRLRLDRDLPDSGRKAAEELELCATVADDIEAAIRGRGR